MRIMIAVAVALVILTPARSFGQTAPAGLSTDIHWRFDGAGRFPHIQPPTEWRSDKNILWKTPVDNGGYSSPIVAGAK